ncbi:hypothetical protein ACFQ3W_06755 [Paenibacillus puldeungensis]|uniref:Lipoprotein n=1 Tax=Paenibacillus puldeungensis TaxID=696536 RepID=A0ABW3RU49_9BACL
MLLLVTGCYGSKESIVLQPATLSEIYPGNILKVNKVELLDGSSGERKVIEDQGKIKKWINLIKDIKLIPDSNQEDRVGFIYGISLYEEDELKLGFVLNHINKIYYKNNIEFEAHIQAFFEEQFEKEF